MKGRVGGKRSTGSAAAGRRHAARHAARDQVEVAAARLLRLLHQVEVAAARLLRRAPPAPGGADAASTKRFKK